MCKAKEPSKGGMPRFAPTEDERALVKLLIANGFAQHVVCQYIRNRRGSHISESTLNHLIVTHGRVGIAATPRFTAFNNILSAHPAQ